MGTNLIVNQMFWMLTVFGWREGLQPPLPSLFNQIIFNCLSPHMKSLSSFPFGIMDKENSVSLSNISSSPSSISKKRNRSALKGISNTTKQNKRQKCSKKAPSSISSIANDFYCSEVLPEIIPDVDLSQSGKSISPVVDSSWLGDVSPTCFGTPDKTSPLGSLLAELRESGLSHVPFTGDDSFSSLLDLPPFSEASSFPLLRLGGGSENYTPQPTSMSEYLENNLPTFSPCHQLSSFLPDSSSLEDCSFLTHDPTLYQFSEPQNHVKQIYSEPATSKLDPPAVVDDSLSPFIPNDKDFYDSTCVTPCSLPYLGVQKSIPIACTNSKQVVANHGEFDDIIRISWFTQINKVGWVPIRPFPAAISKPKRFIIEPINLSRKLKLTLTVETLEPQLHFTSSNSICYSREVFLEAQKQPSSSFEVLRDSAREVIIHCNYVKPMQSGSRTPQRVKITDNLGRVLLTWDVEVYNPKWETMTKSASKPLPKNDCTFAWLGEEGWKTSTGKLPNHPDHLLATF